MMAFCPQGGGGGINREEDSGYSEGVERCMGGMQKWGAPRNWLDSVRRKILLHSERVLPRVSPFSSDCVLFTLCMKFLD